nr:hypothetical protein [Nitrosomonas nitrosa]
MQAQLSPVGGIAPFLEYSSHVDTFVANGRQLILPNAKGNCLPLETKRRLLTFFTALPLNSLNGLPVQLI